MSDSANTTKPVTKRRRPRLRKWGKWLLISSVVVIAAAVGFSRWVAGDSNSDAQIQTVVESARPTPREHLVLMSVNCAHGRGEGMHQVLTPNSTLRRNCEGIGCLLAEHQVDVACMQECDASSWWSGRFNHARLIAESASIPHLVHALNVEGAGLRYGTALMSRFEMTNAATHTFKPTPPTLSKGVAIATMTWPGDDTFDFDVVALHLDFASPAARADQVEELTGIIRKRGKPVIVAGDLNCGWKEGGAVCQLATSLDLNAFEPERDMVTFPLTGEKLDWVLVSSDFEIESVEAIDAKLSDHRPLRAVIRRSDR